MGQAQCSRMQRSFSQVVTSDVVAILEASITVNGTALLLWQRPKFKHLKEEVMEM